MGLLARSYACRAHLGNEGFAVTPEEEKIVDSDDGADGNNGEEAYDARIGDKIVDEDQREDESRDGTGEFD